MRLKSEIEKGNYYKSLSHNIAINSLAAGGDETLLILPLLLLLIIAQLSMLATVRITNSWQVRIVSYVILVVSACEMIL
jgi:hypothetical protein